MNQVKPFENAPLGHGAKGGPWKYLVSVSRGEGVGWRRERMKENKTKKMFVFHLKLYITISHEIDYILKDFIKIKYFLFGGEFFHIDDRQGFHSITK